MEKLNYGNNFDLYSGNTVISGDDLIGFVAPKVLMPKMHGYLDKASVFETMFNQFDDKSHTVHLGMLNLAKTISKVQLPLMIDLLKTNAVLNVKEGGRVTYDLPIPRQPEDLAIVTVDTSKEFPVITEDMIFELVLDKPYTAGDLLKFSPTAEVQVEVSREHPVEPRGEGYLHHVTYHSPSRKGFPIEKLREGTPWIKIGHKNGEMGTQFSTISGGFNSPGHMTISWTPSDLTTVEGAITRKASRMATNGASQLSERTSNILLDKLSDMGGFDARGAFISAKSTVNEKGEKGIDGKSIKVSTALEYLLMVELHKMEAWTNMFATKDVKHGTEGTIKVNDGLWRQMRLGKKIEYTRPGGITLADLQEASNFLYEGSDIPMEDREIVFRGGRGAFENGMKLIQDYAHRYLQEVPQQIIGTDSQLPGGQKILEGDLNNLTLNSILRFGRAYFNGIGFVKFIHDPSFDFNIGTTNPKISGYVRNGLNRNTYTLIVDTASARSGKVTSKVKGDVGLVDGGKDNATVYLVQPADAPYLTTGYTQGRMNDGAKFRNVQSSLKFMGQEFWAHIDTDVLLVDTNKCVVIELKDTFEYE